ncbi:MAG: ArsA family ATPase [Actinomycetota bacterium]
MTGGKGGVGKTTCAAAIALHFASLGKKTLIISSDPTPSLSDIFEMNIGERETPVDGLKNLHGLEITSDIVLKRWKKRFGREIYEVISSFLPVEYEIIDYIGTAPGIEEEYMLDFILELVEGGRYDQVVWDTAPAGHTLQLLDVPKLFITHLTAALKVYMGFTDYLKKMRELAKLKESPRSVIDIIHSWRALAEKVVDFIKDPKSTEFILVTIPEALGVKQSERIVETFDQYGLQVQHMIINNVIRVADSDFLKSRQKMQQHYLDYLKKKYEDRIELIEVPLAPYEIKGIERIRGVSEKLFV